MKKPIRYGFNLLERLILSFFVALLAPFRKPVRDVRQKIRYVRQPRRRMSVFLAAFALLLLFCLSAIPASAQSESFQTTNNLVSGTQYTLYPTNTANTGTGLGVALENGYKTVGLSVSGDVINSNSAPIGISLVRADNTVTAGITNWETTPIYKLIVTVPTLTNHFTWTTNLPEDFSGAGLKMGIEQLTNNFTTGCTISNLVIKPIKKYTAFRFP